VITWLNTGYTASGSISKSTDQSIYLLTQKKTRNGKENAPVQHDLKEGNKQLHLEKPS